jgi:hypothetical protein
MYTNLFRLVCGFNYNRYQNDCEMVVTQIIYVSEYWGFTLSPFGITDVWLSYFKYAEICGFLWYIFTFVLSSPFPIVLLLYLWMYSLHIEKLPFNSFLPLQYSQATLWMHRGVIMCIKMQLAGKSWPGFQKTEFLLHIFKRLALGKSLNFSHPCELKSSG